MYLFIKDYTNFVEHVVKDPKKFRIFYNNPAITQIKSSQSYVRTFLQKNENKKADFYL